MVEDDSPDTGSPDTASPDTHSTNTAVTPERESDPHRREILLALIQHGSKPLGMLLMVLAVMVGIYLARYQIQVWLANAESVKLGTFEVRLREAAALSQEIGKQIRSLGDLTEEQLELFLIVGTQRNTDIHYTGPEVTEPNRMRKTPKPLTSNQRVAVNS